MRKGLVWRARRARAESEACRQQPASSCRREARRQRAGEARPAMHGCGPGGQLGAMRAPGVRIARKSMYCSATPRTRSASVRRSRQAHWRPPMLFSRLSSTRAMRTSSRFCTSPLLSASGRLRSSRRTTVASIRPCASVCQQPAPPSGARRSREGGAWPRAACGPGTR